MINVLLADSEKGSRLKREFLRILSANFEVASFLDGELLINNTAPDFFVCDLSGYNKCTLSDTIVIFADGSSPHDAFFSGRTVNVVDGGKAGAFEAASTSSSEAITCGQSAKDTLTFSSTGVDNTVISLQRNIEAFDGSVVEPQDIPVKCRVGIDKFLLMSIASVFIISGGIEKLPAAQL